MNILNLKSDIVKILFYANLVFLAVAIFMPSTAAFIVAIIINAVFTGTLMVINKYTNKFMAQFSKMWDK